MYLARRTPEEFQAGHPAVADANVPWSLRNSTGGLEPNPAFVHQVQALLWDRSTRIVLGCKSGVRAAAACLCLREHGYGHLISVEGGFDAWAAQGLPVESGEVVPPSRKEIRRRMGADCTTAATWHHASTRQAWLLKQEQQAVLRQ
ncbi:hypothetical protein ABPG75_010889 [Micractinium tetrahymenae]